MKIKVQSYFHPALLTSKQFPIPLFWLTYCTRFLLCPVWFALISPKLSRDCEVFSLLRNVGFCQIREFLTGNRVHNGQQIKSKCKPKPNGENCLARIRNDEIRTGCCVACQITEEKLSEIREQLPYVASSPAWIGYLLSLDLFTPISWGVSFTFISPIHILIRIIRWSKSHVNRFWLRRIRIWFGNCFRDGERLSTSCYIVLMCSR